MKRRLCALEKSLEPKTGDLLFVFKDCNTGIMEIMQDGQRITVTDEDIEKLSAHYNRIFIFDPHVPHNSKR